MATFSTQLDLTAAGCDRLGMPRLYPGDAVTWRFKVFAENAALDLSSYKVVLSVRRRPGSTVILERRSVDDIAGFVTPGTKQIAVDASQGAETVDANGNPTGKGCFEVRFKPVDEALLAAIVGLSVFDIVLESQATGKPEVTYAIGPLEVPSRHSAVARFA